MSRDYYNALRSIASFARVLQMEGNDITLNNSGVVRSHVLDRLNENAHHVLTTQSRQKIICLIALGFTRT